MRRLLCISGKRFSGKDTFAALLQSQARERGVSLHLHAFASESKQLFVAAQQRGGIEVDLERLQSDRAYKEERRPALTRFTVESLAADPLVFCRAVADRVEASPAPSVITDLRLRLEVDHLKPRFDLHVVRLARTDAARAASGWVYKPDVDGHHTETELDDPSLWTEVVENSGTRDALAARAAQVLSAYLR
jgi:phosphomevalonate kinase